MVRRRGETWTRRRVSWPPVLFSLYNSDLWYSEEQSHDPRHEYHGGRSLAARRAEAQRVGDYEVPVEAHGRQDEGRAGQRDDLNVEDEATGDVTKHPPVLKHDEQNLRGIATSIDINGFTRAFTVLHLVTLTIKEQMAASVETTILYSNVEIKGSWAFTVHSKLLWAG